MNFPTLSTRRARAFYLVRFDPRRDAFSRPFERHDNRAQALEAAKADGAQVLSATDYRELTGRTAAADLAMEESA